MAAIEVRDLHKEFLLPYIRRRKHSLVEVTADEGGWLCYSVQGLKQSKMYLDLRESPESKARRRGLPVRRPHPRGSAGLGI